MMTSIKKTIVLFYIALPIILLTSCEKTPEDRANDLIDSWMSVNKPNAVYRKVDYAMPLDFSREDERIFDSLYLQLDSARIYEKYSYSIKDEARKSPALSEVSKTLNSLSNSMTEASKMIAEAEVRIYKDSIDRVKETRRAKYVGEKGYRVRLNYSLNNMTKEIIFYMDQPLNSIVEVEEK